LKSERKEQERVKERGRKARKKKKKNLSSPTCTPTILHLTEPTKTVLAEQATRISQLATTAKEAFTEDIGELEKISALLESVNRGEGTSTVTPLLFFSL